MAEKPFFIGFLPAPPGLRWLLALTGVMIVLLFGAVGWVIGATQADPGTAAFFGREEVSGLMETRPYPMLHVTEGSETIPAGTTILMSGGGKTGVQGRANPLEGQIVTVSGQRLQRGDLIMIQTRGGARGLSPMMGAMPEVPREPLGRWRLTGEICDGKCLTGAMRPGTGLAHKACANLCLIGGVPPVFVSSQPVAGEEFLLIGGPDGGPMPAELLDLTAVYISIEGTVERRGDLLVFLADPDTAEVF